MCTYRQVFHDDHITVFLWFKLIVAEERLPTKKDIFRTRM